MPDMKPALPARLEIVIVTLILSVPVTVVIGRVAERVVECIIEGTDDMAHFYVNAFAPSVFENDATLKYEV